MKARVAWSGSVEVISNVNAQRSAVRSIAWLDLFLANAHLSHHLRCHFEDLVAHKRPNFCIIIDHADGDNDFVVQARVDASLQRSVADNLRHGNRKRFLAFVAFRRWRLS